MKSSEDSALRAPSASSFASFLSMGFRPLYLAGALWAAVSIQIWVFVPALPSGMLQGMAWHAHEMLWGFIAAIAIGFLLTAGTTWTGINPLSGVPLALTCSLWVIARAGFLATHDYGFVVAVVCELAFLVISALTLARVIFKTRSRRNYVLPFLLIALAAIDASFLWAIWSADLGGALERFESGLICMSMIALLVARRVIPFFAMRALPGLRIPMHESTAWMQLVLGVLAVLFALAGWRQPMAFALAVVAGLCAVQLVTWKPWAVRKTPLLWILYLGYAGIGAGFAAKSLHALGHILNPAIHIHVIAIGGLSSLIIGMITRTSLGHLSRPLTVDSCMLASFVLTIAAFALRLIAAAPSDWSLLYMQLAAIAWATAFVLYVIRFGQMLLRPSSS